MKINPTGNPNFIQNSYRAGKVDAYKKSAALPGRDEAALSEEAISFSRVFSEVREAVAPARGEAESGRIAALKAQVEAGTYRIDSEKLAESIIGDLFA